MTTRSLKPLISLWSDNDYVDRLTFLEQLGTGGQAEVWLARDSVLERLVTVKKMSGIDPNEGGERLSSLRARTQVDHPAIPTLLGVIPRGSESWLVSEYIEGVALSELLGQLSPDSLYIVARDLLSALCHLERLSLVHGDLSPNNIVIDLNGQVRLLDFESCSRVGEGLSSGATIGFSAPERLSRRAALPSVDTWSIGAILIWLITQRTPDVVLDDKKRPVSVEIGSAMPATDMLGDVINIAAAATRLNPDLRPAAGDLADRLTLSYRWLEPIDRSVLAACVQSRLQNPQALKQNAPYQEATKAARRRWRPGKMQLSLAALSLVVAGVVAFVHSTGRPPIYTVSVDASRMSPAISLPDTFSPQWITSLFAETLPEQWLLVNGTKFGDIAASDELIREISVNVNCEQGVCELLTELSHAGHTVLDHTVIVDTEDARVWQAAITQLARSVASD